MVNYYHSDTLLWSSIENEDRLLRRIAQSVLILFVVVGIIVPLIPVPQIDRFKEEDLPPRLAKILSEKKSVPKPILEKKEKKKEKKEEKKVEKKKKAPEKVKTEVKKEKKIDIAKAREKAAKSGLLALSDELSDLRSDDLLVSEDIKLSSLSGKSADSEQSTSDVNPSDSPSLLTSGVKSSGGIDVAMLSRATNKRSGQAKLEERKSEKVVSPVDESIKSNRSKNRVERKLIGPRRNEDIQLIMQKYKGQLTRLHTIALRKDPSIEGKVVLTIEILASGKVQECKVLSSDFNAPNFLRKIELRCKNFDFGPAKENMVINYPIDFIPLS